MRVAAKRLYALRHKAKHGYPPDARDTYKLLFLCEPIGEVSPQPGPDVMEVGFFGLDDLPPFSMSRTITDDVTAAFATRERIDWPCSFRLKESSVPQSWLHDHHLGQASPMPPVRRRSRCLSQLVKRFQLAPVRVTTFS